MTNNNDLRNYMLVKILLLAVIISFNTGVFSQEYRRISRVEGLDQRQAFNFFQDKSGFMWISTKFGVNRFDGKNVKAYNFDLINVLGNPQREVHLLSDKDSVLWAYTDNGVVYYYDDKNDRFKKFINVKAYLKTVHVDAENTMWLGMNFYLGRVKNNKLTLFKHAMLEHTMVRKIITLNKSELLVVTTNAVFLFNKTNNHLSELNTEITEKVSTFQIETAYYDAKKQQLWLGTSNNGIALYDFKNGKLNDNIFKHMENNPVFSIHPIDDNYIFIGTDAQGIVLFNSYLFRPEKIHTIGGNNQYGIVGNEIYDLFKDKEGRYWISTYSGGVNIIEPDNGGFSILRNDPNNPLSLTENAIQSILVDNEQNIWFGSNNGISIWNRKKNSWTRLKAPRNVLNIYQDSKSRIWVGTYAMGVYQLNKNGDIVKHIFKNKFYDSGLGTNFIYSIFEDSQNNIWFGGSKGMLTKHDPINNTFKQLPIYQVNNIIQRNKNELLVAATSGIYQVWLHNDQWNIWEHNKNLNSLFVFDMLLESDSSMWISSYGGGVGLCNLNSGKIDYFTQKDGLASDICYALLKDSDQKLWISSENGLSQLDIKTKEIVNFSLGDGISDMAFKPISRAVSPVTGKFLFGSERGVTYFNPMDIEIKKSNSKLILTNFSLFNKVMQPIDKNSPLKDKLDNIKKLKLKHSDHSFSINFTTIDFAQNANQRYMWKLDGLDKDWIGPTNETVANYTNLMPKTYVFRIKAIGNNNMVIAERELKIIISPPFWNTIYAKIIFVVILLLIAYWSFKYLSNIYEKRRTTDKINFFINTTHDLRTPLTLISSPIYELKEKLVLDEWNKYLFDLVITNIDKMNKMVSQLLDFQKAYETDEQLKISKNNLNDIITVKCKFWEPVAMQKNIVIEFQLPESPLYEWFDKQKIEKTIDNLISNAIKYSRDNGSVILKLTFTQTYWQLNIIDRGIGVPENAKKGLFNKFYRAENAINFQETGSGLGLLLIKNYVALHKGKTGVKSTENIGSDFFIRLKRGNKHYASTEFMSDNELVEFEILNSKNENDIFDKQKTRVLIVEDNTDLREYMDRSLSNFFDTYTAKDGKDAWAKILTVNPDIVMSDFNMPEMNGFELCQRIKQTYETSHIPVILLTVITDEKNMADGYKIGADDYIPKPFDVKYLKIKIDNIIANRKILQKKFLDIHQPEIIETDKEIDLNAIFINKATQIIELHMTDTSFNISDFSREMGMSKSLLYTKFNAITGYSPNDFLKIIRMKKALRLFKDGVHNINEVSVLIGFDEPSYFTKCFKKMYGKTPKQFIAEDLNPTY